MDRALFADAIATSIGAIFGTSNTTTYVERWPDRYGWTYRVNQRRHCASLYCQHFLGTGRRDLPRGDGSGVDCGRDYDALFL